MDGTGQRDMPPPSSPSGSPEPSVEKGSTLEAFRRSEQQSVSRRPTDIELPAMRGVSEQPAASTPAPHPQPAPDSAPPSAVTPGPVSRSKFPLIPAAVAAVVLIGVLAVVGGKVFKTSTPDTPPPTPVTEAPATDTPKPGTETPPPAVTPPVTATAPTPPPTTPPPNPTTQAVTSTARPGKTETIPAAVREQLAEAEKALKAGQLDEAMSIARRTQQTQVTEAAAFVIGRVYCQRKDHGNAKAQWRNLSPPLQRKLTAYCKQYEINL
jgi:serine/threonine-protein kinase